MNLIDYNKVLMNLFTISIMKGFTNYSLMADEIELWEEQKAGKCMIQPSSTKLWDWNKYPQID